MNVALFPGILITWSPEDVGPAIEACLLQFYPTLLSTLLSIKRQQLSILDASYALTLSSSPLMVYLAIASICDFCRYKTNLSLQIKSHHQTICFFGALMPVFWIGLSMTLVLSNQAFQDSGLCQDTFFKDWLADFVHKAFSYFIVTPANLPSTVFFAVLAPSLLFLHRDARWVTEHFRIKSEMIRGLVELWCVPVVVDAQS